MLEEEGPRIKKDDKDDEDEKDEENGLDDGVEIRSKEEQVEFMENFDAETMPLNEFLKLDKTEIARNKKVDWDAVLERLLKERKPFSTTYLKKVASECSYKEKGVILTFHYSELMRVIAKWDVDKTLKVTKRVRPSDSRVFYYVIRVG